MTTRARARYEITAEDRASRQVRAIEGRFAGLDGPVGDLTRTLVPASAGMSRMFGAIGRGGVVVGAAAVAVTTLTSGYRAAQSAGSDFVQQQARIEAQIRATGGAAGLTADEINVMARRLGRDTLASATGARAAAGVLLTFTNVVGDNFERTLSLSQDLASVMGTDVTSAARMLGRALEDPVQGVTALRRAGVILGQSQRDMIRNLAETGDVAGATDAILAALEGRVGGAGRGGSGGLAFAADTARESWRVLLEEIGKTDAVQGPATRFFDGLSRRLREARALFVGGDDETMVDVLGRSLAGAEARGDTEMVERLREQIAIRREMTEIRERESQARRQAAGEAAQERAQTEAGEQEQQQFTEQLARLRQGLGSSALALQQQREQVQLLGRAFDEGQVGAAEYVELLERIRGVEDTAKAPGFSGAIDVGRTLLQPGGGAQDQTRELRSQTALLARIERLLATQSSGQAVTI